jgi:DNA polymerase III subunit epsilon
MSRQRAWTWSATRSCRSGRHSSRGRGSPADASRTGRCGHRARSRPPPWPCTACAPSIAEELDDLIGLLSGRAPVAHAAWVERAFLNRSLRPRGWRLHRRLIDTAALLRAGRLAGAATGQEPNLEDAARRLGVPVHTPHHALGDAFTTAKVLLVLATRLERGRPGRRLRPLTVGDLHAVSRHHGGSRTQP